MRNLDNIMFMLLLLGDLLASVYGLFSAYQFFYANIIVDKMHYGFIVVMAMLYLIYRTNGNNNNKNASCV